MAMAQLREVHMMNVNSMAPERGQKADGTVIDINDLSLVFETNDGPVHALSNINLAVKRGEFISLSALRAAARPR